MLNLRVYMLKHELITVVDLGEGPNPAYPPPSLFDQSLDPPPGPDNHLLCYNAARFETALHKFSAVQ